MRARPVHNRAGFVVCLHTLNLRKEYEPYIGVVYLGNPPHHQYTTLAPNVLVTFGRTSPVDRRFKGQEERGGS